MKKSTKNIHVILISIIAIIFGAVTTYFFGDVKTIPEKTGYALGAALFPVIFTLVIVAIVAGIYKLIKKGKYPFWFHTFWPIYLLLAFMSLQGNYTVLKYENRLSKTVYRYSPKDCEYIVAFPGPPKYKKLYLQNMGSFVQAQYGAGDKSNGYFLRAECIHTGKSAAILMGKKQHLLKQISAYTTSNGLSYPTYFYKVTPLGSHASVRGYKTIHDVPVTFTGHIYVGESSLIILYVGGTSKTFPQPNISTFLLSIKRK